MSHIKFQHAVDIYKCKSDKDSVIFFNEQIGTCKMSMSSKYYLKT